MTGVTEWVMIVVVIFVGAVNGDIAIESVRYGTEDSCDKAAEQVNSTYRLGVGLAEVLDKKITTAEVVALAICTEDKGPNYEGGR